MAKKAKSRDLGRPNFDKAKIDHDSLSFQWFRDGELPRSDVARAFIKPSPLREIDRPDKPPGPIDR